MAVILRLSRRGRANSPFYRITVCEKAARRDGKFIEVVGTFNPAFNPPKLVLKDDRVRHWIAQGARPSLTVANIIKKQIPGLWDVKEKNRLDKIRAARAKRKQRAGKKKKK